MREANVRRERESVEGARQVAPSEATYTQIEGERVHPVLDGHRLAGRRRIRLVGVGARAEREARERRQVNGSLVRWDRAARVQL